MGKSVARENGIERMGLAPVDHADALSVLQGAKRFQDGFQWFGRFQIADVQNEIVSHQAGLPTDFIFRITASAWLARTCPAMR